MCFVWVPFRDTKYMLLLYFYHAFATFDLVAQTPAADIERPKKHMSTDFRIPMADRIF